MSDDPVFNSLSHDFGGRKSGMWGNDRPLSQPSVHWTPRMRAAAHAVLALPVPIRDEPAARAGVIDNRKERP